MSLGMEFYLQLEHLHYFFFFLHDIFWFLLFCFSVTQQKHCLNRFLLTLMGWIQKNLKKYAQHLWSKLRVRRVCWIRKKRTKKMQHKVKRKVCILFRLSIPPWSSLHPLDTVHISWYLRLTVQMISLILRKKLIFL